MLWKGCSSNNSACYILYPLVQWNCWFRCSISECNKWFVTWPICNANVCTTSGGCYIWIVTLRWFAHAQSNYNKTINVYTVALCVTLNLSSQASSRVVKNRTRGRRPSSLFYQLDRKLMPTNPMLHAELYISYYINYWLQILTTMLGNLWHMLRLTW